MEHGGQPAAGTDYAALLEQADVVYFPGERAASGAKSEPAALLLEAAQQSGTSYAIAWDLIDATQQATLDALAPEGVRRDELIRKLDLAGSGRAREHCRAVLRDSRVAFLALRMPQPITEKFAANAPLSAEEQAIVPTGYKVPSYEVYAEGLANRGSAVAYRAEILRREFAAEMIVRFFRAAGPGVKLIVFANSNDFNNDRGVPFYVAQKLNVRQLVLGRERTAPMRGSLLALFAGRLRIGFQVVNGAPRAAGY